MATVAASLAWTSSAWAELRAGVGVVDASYKIGSSAGQYASTKGPPDPANPDPEFDPNAQQVKNDPSYGMQSRLQVRALVFQNGSRPVAIAKTDLYIPQDLLWRRAAQILSADPATAGAIGEDNLTMVITHDHSSPYYSSTAFGAWAFQDVFDIRFYDYYAHQIAEAVKQAYTHMHAARVGASPTYVDTVQENVPGPQTADNGTPAGFPHSWSDHNLSVVRFDDISDAAHPKPLANLVSYSLHGESLSGTDLISADWIGAFQRMFDRATGVPSVYMQDAVGNSETETNTYHDIHQRQFFEHKMYQQIEHSAFQLAGAAYETWRRIGAGQPDPGPAGGTGNPVNRDQAQHFVPFSSDPVVSEDNRWFPGPYSHPLPTVGNCRTDTTLGGTPQVPGAGLPDCAGTRQAYDQLRPFGFPPPPDFPRPSQFPGTSAADLASLGLPVPANYGTPSHNALEEALGIHLQAIRIGDLLLTLCSCEQWHDQAQNIRTRTDQISGNEWLGYDWADPNRPDNDGSPGCFKESAGTWDCPHPDYACTVNGQNEKVCPHPQQPDLRIKGISDHDYQVMEAQILNDAGNWNDPSCASPGCGLQAESEPSVPSQIRGGYTHDDVVVPGHSSPGAQQSIQAPGYAFSYGYKMTIPVAMANDYNGYIATLREYQRGDHYRKALTGYGPHSSDYLATRLVWMGHGLRGDDAAKTAVNAETVPGASTDPAVAPFITPMIAKTQLDQQNNEARAQLLGNSGDAAVAAYSKSIPNDGGTPGISEAPKSIQRFDASFLTWVGGDNFTDNPTVKVERQFPDGSWNLWADQQGELPVIVHYPHASSTPDYAQGNQVWKWTADFEAFVSGGGAMQYPLVDPQGALNYSTPPGTYRFVVSGQRQQQGGSPQDYGFTSAPFVVGAYSGIQANDIRREADQAVSFVVGPITKRTSDSVDNGAGPVKDAQIGPIDYPDTYDVTAKGHGVRYINPHTRVAVRDGNTSAPADVAAAAGDSSRLEWYCTWCSFRPWLDFGPAHTAFVTFARVRGRASASAAVSERVPAHRVATGDPNDPACKGPTPGVSLCDRWVTDRKLANGESAYVCPGDLRDVYGNYNGQGSGIVSRGNAIVELNCQPLEEKGLGPIVEPPATASATGGLTNRGFGGFQGLGPAGSERGQTGPAAALGLPRAGRRCTSKRRFRIHIRAPAPGLRLSSAQVVLNGHRLKVVRRHGRLEATVDLRRYRKGTFRITVTVRTRSGRRYRARRTYHLCAHRARHPRHPPRL
ncbi:MAG TPA: hypothetical protein VGN69_07030 [Solirubrobacteraceae bacterium]|nr:hypothetical protein [Solirubrobacteraceae bacterium]